ncbi:unnamed protein product [marine sediment metagenome]|uniref:Uncharacterized protein n=1 Tax=marine sediment metagenome TaxID=412755 RepID=X1SQR8_9ZZZZ
MAEKGFPVGHKKYGGRVAGSGKLGRQFVDMFVDSLSKEKDNTTIGKKLIDHIINRAFSNDVVALGVLKKLLPDLSFSIEKLIASQPVKVTFEIVDTAYSQKEMMIYKNRIGILGILDEVRDGDITVDEGLARLEKELLK